MKTFDYLKVLEDLKSDLKQTEEKRSALLAAIASLESLIELRQRILK